MDVDRTAGLSRFSLGLIVLSVTCGSLSVIFHSRIDPFSKAFFFLYAFFAFFSFIKLMNSIATVFPRPIEILLHWIHAMSFELLAIVSLPFIYLFRLSKTFHQPVGNLHGKPILLIHGYCNNGSIWSYMKYKLAQMNFGPVYSIDLGYPFHSIREYAAKVEEKATQIVRETQRNDLILIGHSMGGLVASLFATEFAASHTVTDVITICSPLKGTYVAKIGIGRNAKEMEYNSELVNKLCKNIENEQFIRFYHIGTNTDQLIIPAYSAFLKRDSSKEFLFEDIGHASMLFSPRVSKLISLWLKEMLSIPVSLESHPRKSTES